MPRAINILKSILGTILSAGLLVISYPQIEWATLAWVGLVPLLFVLDGKGAKAAFGWVYLCGFLFFFGTVGWFIYVTPPGAVVLILYLSLYFGIFGWAFKFFRVLPRLGRLFILPAVWVVLELIRAHFMSGFGWVMLGHSQYKNIPLIQIADITGAYGVSFLVVLVNVLIYETIKSKDNILREQVAVAVILFSVLGYGFWKVAHVPQWLTVSVGVVQPNIPQELKWNEELQPWVVQETITLTQALVVNKPDLIVWPETSLPGIVHEVPELVGAIKLSVKNAHAPLLMGAVTQEQGKYYNSAYLISAQGEMVDRYDKIHLVPFGEYVPFRQILGWIDRLVALPEDFTAGEKYTLLPVRKDGPAFGVLICFEDTLSYLRRNFVDAGAAFFVNMTNDAWFKDTKAPFLHLQAAALQCVEHKRALVRAANTGFSGFVDPLGRIFAPVQSAKHKKTFIKGSSFARVPVVMEKTLYTKYGDIFTWCCFLGILYASIRRKTYV